MKIIGIICEYNPLHIGHHKHIHAIRQKYPDSFIVCLMSGNYVQRGECACVSPYARTQMALKCGADLVLSLPVPYATASAERFALGGISVLGGLGCVDTLAFGSESGNVEKLKKCADILISDDFSDNDFNSLNEEIERVISKIDNFLNEHNL